MSFRQPQWMIGFGHLLGIMGIITGFALVGTNQVSWQWLLLWLASHQMMTLAFAVGLHRYFSHGAFKTTPFWHKVMAYSSVLLLSGSPLGWSTAHIAHHMHADTDRDPHIRRLSVLLWKRYNPVKPDTRRLRYLVQDKTLTFVHRYGLLIWIVAAVAMLAVSWKFFIFGYLMGLGSMHLVTGVQLIMSHLNGSPKNFPLLEFLFPSGGEWLHKTHHDHPGWKDMRTAWWHLDPGIWFIRLIERE